jgi:hypothetical protein
MKRRRSTTVKKDGTVIIVYSDGSYKIKEGNKNK